jgi:hypothetical protein
MTRAVLTIIFHLDVLTPIDQPLDKLDDLTPSEMYVPYRSSSSLLYFHHHHYHFSHSITFIPTIYSRFSLPPFTHHRVISHIIRSAHHSHPSILLPLPPSISISVFPFPFPFPCVSHPKSPVAYRLSFSYRLSPTSPISYTYVCRDTDDLISSFTART